MLRASIKTILFFSLAIIIFNNLGQMRVLFGQEIASGEATLLLLNSAMFAGMFLLLRQVQPAPHL